MTFSKMLTGVSTLTIYLKSQDRPEDGFRLNLGTQSVDLSVEDAAELAEYIWVRLPAYYNEAAEQIGEVEVDNA